MRCADLDSVDGYFRERENNWYFYHDWQALIQSEIDQADAGLTEKECEELIGKMIFKLPDGWYAKTVIVCRTIQQIISGERPEEGAVYGCYGETETDRGSD